MVCKFSWVIENDATETIYLLVSVSKIQLKPHNLPTNIFVCLICEPTYNRTKFNCEDL